MAAQLLVSRSDTDTGLCDSLLSRSRSGMSALAPGPTPSKYLQHHSSLASANPPIHQKQSRLNHGATTMTTTPSLILCMLTAVKLSLDNVRVDSREEYSTACVTPGAPLRPPKQNRQKSMRPTIVDSMTVTLPGTKRPQPLYEYTIMPRVSKVNRSTSSRVTRASARGLPLAAMPASHDKSDSPAATSLEQTAPEGESVDRDQPTGASQLADLHQQKTQSSRPRQDALRPTVGSSVDISAPNSNGGLGSTVAPASRSRSRLEHQSYEPNSLTAPSIKRKRSDYDDEPFNVEPIPHKKLKSISSLEQAKRNMQEMKDLVSQNALDTESASIIATASQNACADASKSMLSDSSDISDPPSSIGSIPTGLISPDEHFERLQVHDLADHDNTLRRSQRNRKATVKSAESRISTEATVTKGRRHSMPSIKRVTFALPPRDQRAASLDFEPSHIGKKRKADHEFDHPLSTDQQTSRRGTSDRAKRIKPSLSAAQTHPTALADSVGGSPYPAANEVYHSDQGVRKPHRGGGRGRGGHNGRGRGGRGRGGAAGRGRGDSPERPNKHILTVDEKAEIARLKKRQAELRHFFQFVGTQQIEILDVMAGRDLATITRKAKAHEKYPEHEEVLEDLAFHRDSKIAQVKRQFEAAEQLALKELEDQKELIDNQFRDRVENAQLEHVKGAAGDLAIFKKAIAAGEDDAFTQAGSEADYFPRYHELPEADATVRGYNSSKIEDEKPFRHDLPTFDEIAARDVMEDEVTRPVVEALHRKRAEEQAAAAREKQARLDEEALEHSHTIAALVDFAISAQGEREIADINDYLNPRSMRAPQYGSFGLSALADAAEAFAKPVPKPQDGLLPRPRTNSQFQPLYPFDHQRPQNLHFPPPPPKLYIPPTPIQNYPAHTSPLRSAGHIASTGPPGSGIISTNKQYYPSNVPPPPPTPQQFSAHPQPSSGGRTPTSSTTRRSLRSIAPQPPPVVTPNHTTPPTSQYQTYTFVPPQQPPQSTHFTPTNAPVKRNSPATINTATNSSTTAAMGPSSSTPGPIQSPMGITSITTGPSHYPMINTGPPPLRPLNQPQSIAPAPAPAPASAPGPGPYTSGNGITMTTTNPNANIRPQPPAPPERKSSGPKQGQGKIAMQFFNSVIDMHGKRALLPKP